MSGHQGNRHIYTPEEMQSLLDKGLWAKEMRVLWDHAHNFPSGGRFKVLIYRAPRAYPYHDITSQVIGHLCRLHYPNAYGDNTEYSYMP